MTFAQPGMLWLLLLAPALVGFFWWSWQKRRQLLEQFIQPRLLGALLAGLSPGRARLRLALVVLGYIFVVLGLARPQWGLVWEEAKQRGLDIVVAMDTSRSMLATDITPNRLTRAKLATLDLLEEARTDRLGLVVFSGTAYLQCPLTTDDSAFRQSLDAVNVGLLPQGGTALAEAITTAMTAYKEEDNHRVLVLFSDGEDHDSGALEAARKAALNGMKIFTVGLGTTEGELLRVPAEKGGTDYVRDAQGNVVKSRLNESLLTEIATATEGGFYLALRGANTIDTLYEKGLAPLPKSDSAERLVKRSRDRFHWPLLLAIACLCAEMLVPDRKRQRAAPNPQGKIKPVPSARNAAAVIALLLFPALATASSSRALREYKSGDYGEALKDFSELARKNPDDPRLHFNAGTSAYRAGDLETAAKHFEQALGARDLNLQQQAYYNRGNTYFRQGETAPDPNQKQDSWQKALKDFDTALKLNAQEPDAKFNYEYVKRQLEELQQQQQEQNQDENQDQKQEQNKDQNQQEQRQEQQKQKDQQQSKSDQEQRQQSQQDQQQQQPAQDQRSKDEQQQQQPQQQKQEEKQKERPQPSAGESKPGDEKEPQESPTTPGEMTPQQARQLLDSLKDGEQMMPIKPEGKPVDPTRPVKDW